MTNFTSFTVSIFLRNAAIQCSGSILHCVSSANEGLQRESVNVQPRNHGPHQALLVLGQEGFSPHPVPVRRPGPWNRGPIPERRSPLHIRRGDQTWPVSLIQYILIFRVIFSSIPTKQQHMKAIKISNLSQCVFEFSSTFLFKGPVGKICRDQVVRGQLYCPTTFLQ